MSIVTIEVEIDHGKVTPVENQPLPEHGRGFLTVLTQSLDETARKFSIGIEADGLPVIQAEGGIITSALVREIEGLPG